MPSGMLIHPAIWPQYTWVEKRGLCSLFGGGGAESNNVIWAEAYLPAKWHLDPSSRLATTDMGQKLEGAVPLWGRGSRVPI